jgi:phenylalanyl-tRNA synthetase beta chain
LGWRWKIFIAYEEVKGGLKGLIIGEVLTVEKHPNADKLTLTTVDINATLLSKLYAVRLM